MNNRPTVIGKGRSEKLRPGLYRIRHSLGKDPETGKYRYSPWRNVSATRKSEVTAALEEYKREINAGGLIKPAGLTVGQYARDFHALREGSMKSPLAYKREALEVRHICELFSDIPLDDFKPFHIRNGYAKALKTARFSDGELAKTHRKLKQILNQAIADELIEKNPCNAVVVKKPAPAVREALSAKDASRLLSCLESSPLDAHIVATLLLLDTGMRRGEVLGLTWENFNAARGTVRITQQYSADLTLRPPKSNTSRRLISLSSRTTRALSLWKTVQV